MNTQRIRAVGLVIALTAVLVGCPKKEEPPPVKQATPVQEPAIKAELPPEPKAVRECAAPIDLAPPQELKIGDRTASLGGYKLAFSDKDKDGTVNFGVLGPINEDSGQNMLALKKYLKFFSDEKVDAIIVTGDVGEVADGITRVLKTLADSKLPVFVIAGNRECRAEYTDGVNAASAEKPNVVNMNVVRAVQFPELTLVSLPGHHDPNYINCATGCRFYKSTVDEVIRVAKEATGPVLLVAHGPPHGDGSQALDYASGGNVGSEEINRALKEGNIPFGAFSNIKEAGARATSDAAGTTQVKPGTPSKTLYLNPGPADTVGWPMNDNTTSVGIAAVLSIKDGQATYKLMRAKPLTAGEKAEAKRLDPPTRPEPGAEPAQAPAADAATPTPAPPPGAPAPVPAPAPTP